MSNIAKTKLSIKDVLMIRNSEELRSKSYTPHTVFFTNDANSKLGANLKVADVDNDSMDDIVVGAPGFGKGCIYIIYGSSIITFPEGIFI